MTEPARHADDVAATDCRYCGMRRIRLRSDGLWRCWWCGADRSDAAQIDGTGRDQ